MGLHGGLPDLLQPLGSCGRERGRWDGDNEDPIMVTRTGCSWGLDFCISNRALLLSLSTAAKVILILPQARGRPA
jgi:hypothetical protein